MTTQDRPVADRISRRQLLAAAAASAVPALSIAADPLPAAGERELTWYLSHLSAPVAEEIGRMFTNRYPGIKVNVVRTTAQVAYQRLTLDRKNKLANCDIFSTPDVSHFVSLKAAGALLRYTSPNAEKLFPVFRDADPDGYYHVVSASLLSIVYNKNLVRPDEAPKTWKELIDPKWRSKLVVGNPAFSSFMGNWVLYMNRLYGWDYLERLRANRPFVGRSIIDGLTMLNSGERAVAVAPASLAEEAALKGAPLAVSYPSDGSILMLSFSAIPADAPHPNAAKLFLNFVHDIEICQLAIPQFGEPLRPEVVLPPGRKSAATVKIYRPAESEVAKNMQEAIERWREAFGA